MRKLIYLNGQIVLLIFVSIFLFSSATLCQTQITQTAQELFVWQQRVDGLTDGIVKDSKSVDDSERGLYLALLAKMWWKLDPVEAKKYLKKSVDTMLNDLESDDKTGLAKKLKNSQKTIQIIASLDEQLSQSLAEKIAKILEAKGSSDKSNADSFVMIALQVVDKNRGFALALGSKSLTYGNSLDLPRLISDLNLKDSKLADDLLLLSLTSVRRNYDYSFIGTLGNYVFSVRHGKAFSDASRRSYLEMLADMISIAALDERNRTFCEIVPIATPILARFDEYLMARALAVRQQIDICVRFSDQYTAVIAKAQASGEEPKTADEYIQAARETSDPGKKNHYFHRAIAKLEQLKKFDEVISLLDGMTEDERKIVGTNWDYFRGEGAYQAALSYVNNKDMPAVYRIINRTPKKNRPWVRFRLAFKLLPVDYRDFILENLEELRKELGSLEIPENEAAGNFIGLARLYVKIQPTESEGMFREAVKYINKTDANNPDFLPEKDWSPLNDYVRLPYELLETDESGIFSSLANISSRRSRVRLKLGLLESSLQKLVDVKKKVELESKEKKK